MAQTVKNLPVMQQPWVQSLGQKDPLEEEWLPTAVFLPGKSHGQGKLAGYSTRGHKELDTTEQLTHTHRVWVVMFSLSFVSRYFLFPA